MARFVRYGLLALLLSLHTGGEALAQADTSRTKKWSGNLELISGLGFNHIKDEGVVVDTLFHIREQAILQLKRTTPTFSFTTQAQGIYEKNGTYTRRISMKHEKEVEILGRGSNFLKPGSNLRSEFSWRPGNGHQLTAFLSYQYGYDHADNVSVSITADTSKMVSLKSAVEDLIVHQHMATAGWRSSHPLGSSRHQLLTAGEWKGSFRRQQSEWTKLMLYFIEDPSKESSANIYRLTPSTDANEETLTVSYRDSLLGGKHKLTVEPGMRIRLQHTLDENNGAVRIDEHTWRDSTRLHEDFNYFTAQMEPQLRLEYHYLSLRVSADYSLQLYGRQLNNHLHYQAFQWQQPAVVGRTFIEWSPSSIHQLTLGSSMSLTRPTYLQICWYDRQGTDPSQLFEGNPDLLPTRSYATDLTWRLRLGRFRLNAVATYDYRIREIEQFFYDDVIDGQNFRIFTWQNSAYSHIFTERLQLSWNGQVLSSNVNVNFQQKKQTNPIQEKTSQFNHWNITADITVRPGQGWSISTSGSYNGNNRSLYRLVKQYYTLNARITKEFKRIAVYLEGRDLLDQVFTTQYYSQDMSDQWEETSTLNRRLFQLGFTWKF